MKTILLTAVVILAATTAQAQFYQPYGYNNNWNMVTPAQQHYWELQRIRAYGQAFGHHRHRPYYRPYYRPSPFERHYQWQRQQILEDIEYQLWRHNQRQNRW